MAPGEEQTIDLREAAGLLGLEPRAVMALVDEGALPATVVIEEGRHLVRFRRRDVEAISDV